MQTLALYLIQLVTFIAVVAIAYVGVNWAQGALVVRRRLSAGTQAEFAADSPLLKEREVRNSFLAWVQDATLRPNKENDKLRKDLLEAGFEHPSAPIYYVILRFSLAIGLPLLFLVSQQLVSKPLGPVALIIFPLFLCGIGLLVPGALLGNRVEARRTQLDQEFPDALDLMVVCVEAGLGLEAAFVRVGQELRGSHPLISATLERVAEELRAGRNRQDALRGMSERVNVDSLRAFAALLIQTDTLGTSIATTLRTFSNEMRETRFLKGEEKAMRIPVLMTIPLVACIMPVIVVALMLPPAIDVMRDLLPALNGVR